MRGGGHYISVKHAELEKKKALSLMQSFSCSHEAMRCVTCARCGLLTTCTLAGSALGYFTMAA